LAYSELNNGNIIYAFNHPKERCAERRLLDILDPEKHNGTIVVVQIQRKSRITTRYILGKSLPCGLCRSELSNRHDVNCVKYSCKRNIWGICHPLNLPDNGYYAFA